MADRIILWTLQDPRGLSITLTSDVWEHIVTEHSEIADYPDTVRQTIADPDAIYFDEVSTQKRSTGTEVHAYYRARLLAGELSDEFVYVSVKLIQEGTAQSGFVQTAFPARAVQKRMVLIWTK